MIFFAISFIASLFGGISAYNIFDFSFQLNIGIEGPYARIISFWPFIVALVLLLLVILWYQNIKNLKRARQRSAGRHRQRNQSVVILGIVTVLVIVLLAAPYYLQTLENNERTEQVSEENLTELKLTVYGMTCSGCEALVNRKVGELQGVESVKASHVNEEVYIVYDKSKIPESLIAETIEEAGYSPVFE
ncbi:MAG: copper chaperone [Bacteroidetes bacterium]|nr:MAG: copper chaperone [Bacteroidota bacterium]